MNHHPNFVQATYIWGTVKEKVVEGKDSAAEKVTLLKEATVEKVNSMKENVDDAITFESDSPVRERMMHQLTIMVINLMPFSTILIMMTPLQALEATWFSLGSSGKGQLDESQVFKINHQLNY